MEFNSINFNIQINTNQKAGLVNNLAKQNQNQAPLENNMQNQNQAQNINPVLLYDFQAARMDNETVLKYLQNLMKLPDSIDKFLAQLNSKNVDAKLTSFALWYF